MAVSPINSDIEEDYLIHIMSDSEEQELDFSHPFTYIRVEANQVDTDPTSWPLEFRTRGRGNLILAPHTTPTYNSWLLLQSPHQAFLQFGQDVEAPFVSTTRHGALIVDWGAVKALGIEYFDPRLSFLFRMAANVSQDLRKLRQRTYRAFRYFVERDRDFSVSFNDLPISEGPPQAPPVEETSPPTAASLRARISHLLAQFNSPHFSEAQRMDMARFLALQSARLLEDRGRQESASQEGEGAAGLQEAQRRSSAQRPELTPQGAGPARGDEPAQEAPVDAPGEAPEQRRDPALGQNPAPRPDSSVRRSGAAPSIDAASERFSEEFTLPRELGQEGNVGAMPSRRRSDEIPRRSTRRRRNP
jgi:hypothetical protein